MVSRKIHCSVQNSAEGTVFYHNNAKLVLGRIAVFVSGNWLQLPCFSETIFFFLFQEKLMPQSSMYVDVLPLYFRYLFP